jgi:hypothetical protein
MPADALDCMVHPVAPHHELALQQQQQNNQEQQ